jgi:hypothetical protein
LKSTAYKNTATQNALHITTSTIHNTYCPKQLLRKFETA